jgi:hypothetical protein
VVDVIVGVGVGVEVGIGVGDEAIVGEADAVGVDRLFSSMFDPD